MAIAAQAPPGSDRLVMLPYLLSERAPHWARCRAAPTSG